MGTFAEKARLTQEQYSAMEGFKKHLEGDGKSPRTVQSYLGDIHKFLKYLHHTENTEIAQISRSDATSFFAELVHSGQKPATVNKAVNSLACFCRYLKDAGLLPENLSVVSPRKDRVKVATGSEGGISVFTNQQVNALLALANDRNKTSFRNRLIVHLLLYAGLRVSELVTLRLADLDLVACTLNVNGKGGKLREVPLKAETINLTKEYLRNQRAKSKFADSDYLFVTQRAPKMHRDAINTMLERMSQELGFAMHPHQFRHTFCSMLVQKGVPLTTVAKLAGHASIQTTTAFYVNTSRKDKANAINLL